MASRGRRDDKVELLRALPWAARATDEDLRWLGRVADALTRPTGSVVARRTVPSRWSYVVVSGTVAVGEGVHGPGAVVLPEADVVVLADAVVLAFPRAEEPALQRRFPELAPEEVRAPAPARVPHCPVAACLRPQLPKARASSALETARSA